MSTAHDKDGWLNEARLAQIWASRRWPESDEMGHLRLRLILQEASQHQRMKGLPSDRTARLRIQNPPREMVLPLRRRQERLGTGQANSRTPRRNGNHMKTVRCPSCNGPINPQTAECRCSD